MAGEMPAGDCREAVQGTKGEQLKKKRTA